MLMSWDPRALVQRDEKVAHLWITHAFRQLSIVVGAHGGTAHEFRGDALVAKLSRATNGPALTLRCLLVRE